MSADQHLVSVVLTAYDGRRFIGEAIQSILDQTYRNLELIIVDDASTDDTVAVIEGFRDSRIRLIRNAANQGISISRNIGIRAARGSFIAAHDQDDRSAPERLALEVALLRAEPEVVLVCGRVRNLPEGDLFPPLPLPSPAALAWRLFTRSIVMHSTVCLRAETLRRHDLYYQQRYHYAEDFELYHRLSEVGDLKLVDRVLADYRNHEGNTSRTRFKEMIRNGQAFLLQRYRDYLGESRVDAADIERIWRLAVEGNPPDSRAEMLAVGRVLNDHVAAFLERRGYGGQDRLDVLTMAGAIWWRILAAGAKELGPSCLRLFRRYPNLSSAAPGHWDLAKSAAGALAWSALRCARGGSMALWNRPARP